MGEIVATYADQLAGKTVVDITNPVDFTTFDSLVVPAGSSLTAQIQDKLPRSRVVKAFNRNFAATLASGKVGELPTTVLVAGDDSAAKSALIAAIEAGGLGAIDAPVQRTTAWLVGHTTPTARTYTGLAHGINADELGDVRDFLATQLKRENLRAR